MTPEVVLLHSETSGLKVTESRKSTEHWQSLCFNKLNPELLMVYITNASCLEEITSQKGFDKKLNITKRNVFQSRGMRSFAEATDVPTTSAL